MSIVPAVGPKDAKLYIVGEAPGKEEVSAGKPFVGASGLVLNRLLQKAGFDRDAARINNVVQRRPPNNKFENWWMAKLPPTDIVREGIAELKSDILAVRPNLILGLGATPLRALVGHSSILQWRGSHLEVQIDGHSFRYFPTYHPAYLLRQPQDEFIATQDVGRAVKRALDPGLWPQPVYNFQLRPSFEATCKTLSSLLDRARHERLVLSVDIETRRREIACVGIAWSRQDAICIPVLCTERVDGYFLEHEELEVVQLLRALLMHPNVEVVGQNWPYDGQYLARQWGIRVRLRLDTMTAHHAGFSMLRKGLDFLSSIYLEDHVYWKDEGKEWDPSMPEERLWNYNCIDAVRTYAVAEEIQYTLAKLNHKRTKYGTPVEIQHRVQEHLFNAMLRGVKVSHSLRAEMERDLDRALKVRRDWLKFTTGGTEKMANSPKQLCKLFYEDMGIRPVMNYHVSPPAPTTNDEALEKIKLRDPLAIPICETISEIRSMVVFSSVCRQPLDHDGRIRCSYVIPGTSTYRLASKEDAFGFGTNLQNVSTGAKYEAHGDFEMPNLRKWFIPDEGKLMGDYDGAQADARVVAWEAGDEELKAIFRDPSVDIHIENAKTIFGACTGKSDPRRQLAKTGVHAANYGVTAATLAGHLGTTVHEADYFLKSWYGAHPAIPRWWDRVRFEIASRRYVENAFGYRGHFFGRIDDVFKEALAWVPQSTVGIMINIGICQVCEALPQVDLLLQTHDSATFQFDYAYCNYFDQQIRKHMAVEIPYEDPLIIPIDSHLGHSWGECK